jgi:hypothetical protein
MARKTGKNPQSTNTAESTAHTPTERVSGSEAAHAERKITVRREGDSVIVSVPVRFYRRNGRQMILTEGGETETCPSKDASMNNTLVSAIAKAYLWQEQLDSGRFEGLEDLAAANGVDRSYVGRILQLTSLAPDIVESILDGRNYADLSLRDFRKGIPVAWEEQRRVLVATKAI